MARPSFANIDERLARRRADEQAKDERRKARCLVGKQKRLVRSWLMSFPVKERLRLNRELPWEDQIALATKAEADKAERLRQRLQHWEGLEGRARLGLAPSRPARQRQAPPRAQPAVKAIETHYKGYRFRSRLEARWAVAFTAQQIDWDYEPEGFELPSGRYLPDFWLPQVLMWAEVKPCKPTDRELRLAEELAMGTGHMVLLLIGQPDDLAYWAVGPDPWSEPEGGPAMLDYSPFDISNYHLSEGRFFACSGGSFSNPYPMPFKNERWDGYPMPPGVAAARAARFEHGESPA